MRAVISEALGRLSLTEAVDLLAGHGIVARAVRSYQQVVESEDVQRLDMFPLTEPGASGRYRHVVAPYAFRDLPRSASRPAPGAGRRSRQVLAELGYPEREIDALVETGVVGDGRHAGGSGTAPHCSSKE